MSIRKSLSSFQNNLTSHIKQSGALNDLYAHYLSQVGVAVVKHHINQLKSYNGPPRSKAQKIAAFLIIKYLTEHKMVSSLECAKYETLKGLFIKQDLTSSLQCPENSNIISYLIQDRLMLFNSTFSPRSSQKTPIYSPISSSSYIYKAKSPKSQNSRSNFIEQEFLNFSFDNLSIPPPQAQTPTNSALEINKAFSDNNSKANITSQHSISSVNSINRKGKSSKKQQKSTASISKSKSKFKSESKSEPNNTSKEAEVTNKKEVTETLKQTKPNQDEHSVSEASLHSDQEKQSNSLHHEDEVNKLQYEEEEELFSQSGFRSYSIEDYNDHNNHNNSNNEEEETDSLSLIEKVGISPLDAYIDALDSQHDFLDNPTKSRFAKKDPNSISTMETGTINLTSTKTLDTFSDDDDDDSIKYTRVPDNEEEEMIIYIEEEEESFEEEENTHENLDNNSHNDLNNNSLNNDSLNNDSLNNDSLNNDSLNNDNNHSSSLQTDEKPLSYSMEGDICSKVLVMSKAKRDLLDKEIEEDTLSEDDSSNSHKEEEEFSNQYSPNKCQRPRNTQINLPSIPNLDFDDDDNEENHFGISLINSNTNQQSPKYNFLEIENSIHSKNNNSNMDKSKSETQGVDSEKSLATIKITVIEATGIPRTMDGEPGATFCSLYLMSQPEIIKQTRIDRQTPRTPKWNEDFILHTHYCQKEILHFDLYQKGKGGSVLIGDGSISLGVATNRTTLNNWLDVKTKNQFRKCKIHLEISVDDWDGIENDEPKENEEKVMEQNDEDNTLNETQEPTEEEKEYGETLEFTETIEPDTTMTMESPEFSFSTIDDDNCEEEEDGVGILHISSESDSQNDTNISQNENSIDNDNNINDSSSNDFKYEEEDQIQENQFSFEEQ